MKENQQVPIRWAIIGVGVVAREMAEAMKSLGRVPAAVGNRTQEKAVEFAKTYGIPKVYLDLEDAFRDPDIDALYLTTPHSTHHELLLKALEGGKHVLCEKSITLGSHQLEEVMNVAQEKGLVLGEAMTLYHMPLYKTLKRRLEAGDFGRINLIQCSFGSFKDYDMNNRFFRLEDGGGALLDIGVYALSLVRWFMESNPDRMESLVKFAPSGADEMSGILLMNPEGQLGVLSLSLHSKQPKRAVISGELAYVEILEYPRATQARIVWTNDGRVEELIEEEGSALVYELLDMEKAIGGDGSLMHLDLTRDVLLTMTELRRGWGLRYPHE